MPQSTQVTFYLFSDKNGDTETTCLKQVALPCATTDITDDEAELYYHACRQAASFYRQNQKVFIYCPNQEVAQQIDELLWAFEPNSFVAHNLLGEGAPYGAAVEISWQAPTNKRQVLINLTNTVPDFSANFTHIIDFVPRAEKVKQQARERFKIYRQKGYELHNLPVPETPL